MSTDDVVHGPQHPMFTTPVLFLIYVLGGRSALDCNNVFSSTTSLANLLLLGLVAQLVVLV